MKKLQAFSLVELSIVLIIISLLVAAVIGGKSMLSNSKQRAFMSEIQSVKTALNAFRVKYKYLPGDLPNAYDHFGHKDATCTDGAADPVIVTGCNGNGNGLWDGISGAADMYMAWFHMQLAGLLSGPYTGRMDMAAVPAFTTDKNSFASDAMEGVLFVLLSNNPPSVPYYNKYGGNVIRAGVFTYGFHQSASGYLTPEETFIIDTKYDDGSPKSGDIIGHNHNDNSVNFNGFGSAAQHCTTVEYDYNATDTALEGATYRLDNSMNACEIDFIIR